MKATTPLHVARSIFAGLEAERGTIGAHKRAAQFARDFEDMAKCLDGESRDHDSPGRRKINRERCKCLMNIADALRVVVDAASAEISDLTK